MTSLNFLNILQSIIIFSGLVAGLVVCSKAGPHAALHVLLLRALTNQMACTMSHLQ